jgi:phosphotriesterase-related protein
MTVLGPAAPAVLGVCDAHNHLWIDAVAGGAPDGPVLNWIEGVLPDLRQYQRMGGGAVVDCQPGGCGRDARRLIDLSTASGVQVIATTGFHRRRYYPADAELFALSADQAARRFLGELKEGLDETLTQPHTARAGYVKAACEARLEDSQLPTLEGAALAARESGAALMLHTEKGAGVEHFLNFLTKRGVDPHRVVFFHIDKRPDFGFQRELAQAGVMLEYDTFYRPRYQPETHLWPLIERMAAAGLAGSVALGTDMAETGFWRGWGGRPGLTGLITLIRPRLLRLGLDRDVVDGMTGGNILSRLAYA